VGKPRKALGYASRVNDHPMYIEIARTDTNEKPPTGGAI